jgi:hypothetical protein
MNTPLIRWLLNIETIPADAESVHLVWEHPWPGWAWALLVVAAAAFAIWSYTRLTGSRPVKATLASVRFAIIILVLILLSGPMLEMPRETIEQDWVLVLVDRSASMRIADVHNAQGERISRDAQLRSILHDNSDMFNALAEQKQLVWLGFHVGAYSLQQANQTDTPTALAVDLGEADGRRTSINAALQQALQRAAGRPLSGIVLISDGRTHDPPTRSTIRQLQADAVEVFPIPVGSDEPFADIAIRRIDAPRRAYVGDKVPVTVQLDRLGEAARAIGANITLIDELTGEVLASDTLAPNDDRHELILTAEPQLAGETNWMVRIDSDQPALVPENLVRSFNIVLTDQPLRVLYIDGYPRWEYRYVKNLLIREQSLESSVMLLSADRDFAQEGNMPITRLPRSPGEFADYDVIVLGDVPASFFTTEQLEMIRDHVADYGAGLLWIAGPRSTPNSFAGTALADLLPIRAAGTIQSIGRPVLMQPTELADRLGVLQLSTGDDFGWPAELTDTSYGWSQLHYAQRLEPSRLKPTAEVLAHTTERIGEAQLPLVTLMRFGAGQSIYVATDEIWRWRYGRGELLPEQFWVQMMRMLGRESLSAADQQAILEVSPRRVEVSQPMRVDLRVLDEQLSAQALASIRAVLHNDQGETVAEIELLRMETAEARYAATFLPDQPGQFRVRLNDSALQGLNLDTDVEVFAPDDELRQPETDHALLAALADETGGRMLYEDTVSELPELLPSRSIRTVNPLTERIWDTPLFFIVILLALTGEWIGRKMLRLV